MTRQAPNGRNLPFSIYVLLFFSSFLSEFVLIFFFPNLVVVVEVAVMYVLIYFRFNEPYEPVPFIMKLPTIVVYVLVAVGYDSQGTHIIMMDWFRFHCPPEAY